jgi:hypothetical protein
MGDDQVPHVGHADVQGAQVTFESAQRVGGIPTTVDQQVAVVSPNEIRVDVPERAVFER